MSIPFPDRNAQLLSFTETRARRTDPDTSKAAARSAKAEKAESQRILLAGHIRSYGGHWAMDGWQEGWTAKEIAEYLEVPLADCYRRLPECAGIKPHETLRRDGCRVWVKS